MGIEFIRRAAPSFKKRWDHSRIEVATPNFFTQKASRLIKTELARITNKNYLPQEGGSVVIELREGKLIVMDVLNEVACFIEPSSELIRGIQQSNNIASGIITKFHPISRNVDIEIC